MDTFTPDHACMIHAYKLFLYGDEADVMSLYRDVLIFEERLSDVDAELCKIEAMAQVEMAGS